MKTNAKGQPYFAGHILFGGTKFHIRVLPEKKGHGVWIYNDSGHAMITLER